MQVAARKYYSCMETTLSVSSVCLICEGHSCISTAGLYYYSIRAIAATYALKTVYDASKAILTKRSSLSCTATANNSYTISLV